MKILSLSGGGTSGYMSASFLSLIEKETGKKITDEVKIIAGTSTGSLIGAALTAGMTPDEIKNLYVDLHKDIFGKGRGFIRNLFKPKFNIEDLIGVVQKHLGDKKIGDLENDFMCCALHLGRPHLKPKFWKTWDEKDKETKILDAVIASSCFPGGFSPHKVGEKYYYDGGLVANDPTLCVMADAVNYFKVDPKDLQVLSLQTDFHGGYDKPEKFKGLISIMTGIPSMCIDGSERIVDYIANRIYGKKVVTTITPKVYFPVDSNDWVEMDKVVETTWNENKEEILRFFR